MTTHANHFTKNTAYFITFTCFKWMNLIEMANAYNAFYKWFDYLKSIHVNVLGYVIMPNHFHGLLFIPENCSKMINQIVSNGKRFIAYDIISGLKEHKRYQILAILRMNVTNKQKQNGSKHRVFITSFDCKEMFNLSVLETKLGYIHRNPCSGKRNLAKNFTCYRFSSASFYELSKSNQYLTHYREVY